MTIGLLVCDRVMEEYLHIQGDYPDMFRSLLPEMNFRNYFVCDGIFPKNTNECEVWMVTGSKHSVYDEIDWILQLKSFVLEIWQSQTSYIGVCFGHQMLAEALGGKVQKAESGWSIGVNTFEISQHRNWILPPRASLNLLMMCQDQVKVLPENSTVLAHTSSCPVGMFTVGNKMLGIQAHPEFSKKYNQTLMEDRLEIMGKEKVENGLESLSKELDNSTIVNWIINFIQQNSIHK